MVFADLCYYYRLNIPAADLPGKLSAQRVRAGRRQNCPDGGLMALPGARGGGGGATTLVIPAEVTSRPNCQWGRGCWTQVNDRNPAHRRRYNHILP